MRRPTLKQTVVGTLLLLCLPGYAADMITADSDRLRRYEFDIFGPSYEAAMEQAGQHAVRSAVGEFYLSDEMLLARDLLNRYVANYHKRFIDSSKVLSRSESQGLVFLRVSFVVNSRMLEEDLRQKRFFYTPRRRPFIYVSIAETVDGAPATSEPISRASIHRTLEELLMRYESRIVFGQVANIDLTQDPQQQIEARRAAERVGVEVILTGRVDLKLERQKKVHFDDYTFYAAHASLALIRVDDGQVLAGAAGQAGAGNVNADEARRMATERAAGKLLRDVVPSFATGWERTMTDNVEFQVMLTGVNATEAEFIHERLRTHLTVAEIHRRSLFEDVVVFNVYYAPDQARSDERQRIEAVLRDLVSPRFRIVPDTVPKRICAKRIS